MFDRQQSLTVQGDIICQITSWNAFDFEYDVEGGEYDTKYLIKVYGVTAEGHSVSVNIQNYTPFFLIKVTHSITSLFLDRLREHIVCKLPSALRGHFLGVKLLKKKDFWGFQNNEKFNFIRLSMTTYNAFRAVQRIFQRDVQIMGVHSRPVRYKIYEANIEPFLRFIHIKDISPSGWIRIPDKRYDVNEVLLPTICQIDINCDWKCVERVERDKIAPLCVASFDIECTSSHGDFPVAKKDYKKVAYEMLQAFLEEKLHEYNIVTEVIAIFSNDVPGLLSKVYIKEYVNLCVIRRQLEKGCEDILNILRGRVVYKNEKYTPVLKSSKDDIMKTLTRKLGTYEGDVWTGFMPRLLGDTIIQIGTTVHRYGETECFYRNIITVGTCSKIDDVEVMECKTEAEALLKWRQLILDLDPDVCTGYNIFGFDFAYMYMRAQELGIKDEFCKIGRIVDKSCDFTEKTLSSSALGDNLLRYIDMDGRVLIDIMKVVQRDHKLDSFKLDSVANHFMKMNKHDVSPNDIFRLNMGTADDRKTIAEYCVQDCALCNKLMMKLEILANNIGMSNVCNVPLSFIFMRGQGVKIFSLVAKQCREDDFCIPTIMKSKTWGGGDGGETSPEDEEGYEGAIVLPPKEGIYLDDPVSVLDYASLYPSSMISENLSHDCIVLDPKYDNLDGIDYLDITYDIYDYVNDKKTKVGEKVCRFVQYPDNKKGVIPRILDTLLKARKNTRKKMEFKTVVTLCGEKYDGLVDEYDDTVTIKRLDGGSVTIAKKDMKDIRPTYDEFEKAVLDGLQVAYKVTANSLYGQIGAKTSPIYLKEIAACTTATGRKMILMAKKFLEDHYMAEIVYGDSVTHYTPVLIRHDGMIKVEAIKDIGTKYGGDKWTNCRNTNKESCEVFGVDAWTETGWTPIERVIRHSLASHKKIIRVTTASGMVDVTDDHSLLRADGNEVSPRELKYGDCLLHAPYPPLVELPFHTEVEAQLLGYMCEDVPETILNSPENIRRVFLEGHEKGIAVCNGISRSQVAQAKLNILKHSLGSLLCSSSTGLQCMEEVSGYAGYVYDLTTVNHHFQAGVGQMIVHNTDSIFAVFPNKDENGNKVQGKDAIMLSIDSAIKASSEFKKLIKHPHDLEYEKTFFPFILFSKKRYCANKYEHDNKKCKMNSMGIALKRRDNAPIVKHIYGGIIDIILNEHDIGKSIKFLTQNLNDLITGKFPLESLIITKSLRADYKDPEKIAHKVLAERIGERDPGNKPMVNDRIPFVYIQHNSRKGEKVLQGNRIEHPDFIKKEGLKPDYEFYITNQIMKPVLQLYALTLETLDGYKKGRSYFQEIEKKLVIDKEGDAKKVKERLNDLRETEVQKLLFDPILVKLQNKKNGNKEITDFFPFVKPT